MARPRFSNLDPETRRRILETAAEEFAANIGVAGYRVANRDGSNGGLTWSAIVREVVDRPRRASVARKTKETDIVVEVDLDAERPISIATGIGFFDLLAFVGVHAEKSSDPLRDAGAAVDDRVAGFQTAGVDA